MHSSIAIMSYYSIDFWLSLKYLIKSLPQRNGSVYNFTLSLMFIGRGEEGQPHQSLVRTTFLSFSRPNHIEILFLSILFFLSVRSLKINTFFKNMATLGHKT